MPFCTYCGQSFARDEHLERHILTHTNVKPYKCFTCQMSFARRDLLHRHYTVHGKNSSQAPWATGDGLGPTSVGRTPIACHNCATAKTKCDKKLPCARCANRGLTCTARPTRRRLRNLHKGNPIDDPKASSSENLSHGSGTDSSCISPPRNSFMSMPAIAIRPNTSVSQSSGCTDATACASGVEDLKDYTHSIIYERNSDPLPSSQQLLNWQQLTAPLVFNQKPDMITSTSMDIDASMFIDQLEHPSTFMFDFAPGVLHSQPCLTSLTEEQRRLPSRPITSSHQSASGCDSRQEYAEDDSAARDGEAVINARDSWSAFKCNPVRPSSLCPKTARMNLEQLERNLKIQHRWTSQLSACEKESSSDDLIFVAGLREITRDKLLAITQSFLYKALEIHNDSEIRHPQFVPSGNAYGSKFIMLPPARILHAFLRSYVNGFERFYPIISKGILDPNQLLCGFNDKAASLLILLMIAQGATLLPDFDARDITAGLTETCRISLFDLIEKNVLLASDPVVLHSALLFTVQAAWSGDKWHMDIAMGQRGMYLAMLRHSGRMEVKNEAPNASKPVDSDTLWKKWVEQETNSRLVYAWAIADHDLSMFYDTIPLFSVTEFGEAMPDSDSLWRAKCGAEWSELFGQAHETPINHSSIGPRYRPLSLRDLFRHFLDDAIVAKRIELTPLHLRLLLHPLQSLVCQFRQLLSCFSDRTASRTGSKIISAASTRARLEEVQMLLTRWYGLAEKFMKTNYMCPLMQTNLVMFHLISLNAVTNFPEIERLARREDGKRTFQRLHRIHKRCIANVEQAIFHCSQVIREIRSMPPGMRPSWWAGAVYRAALILWTESLANNESIEQGKGVMAELDTSSVVHDLPPHNPVIGSYLAKSEGTPTLTKREGSLIPIKNPLHVLFYSIDVINEGISTSFSDGIRSKLSKLVADESR